LIEKITLLITKSTLALELEHSARYLTFDDAAVLAAARHDPAGFVAGLEGPVIIDEVQLAPDIFPALKLSVDRNRQPGRFLLTGSANILLLPRLSESLAGRMEILTLWPLSQGEIDGIAENLVDRLFSDRFTLPRSRQRAPSAAPISSAASCAAVIRRCSVERPMSAGAIGSALISPPSCNVTCGNIEGFTELPRVLALLATRASSLHNLADISRGIGILQTTLKRYLTLLEATFLLVPLPAWSSNLGKRLVKAPKLALSDTGLLTYLLGANEEKLNEDGPMFGQVLENFVVTELRKQSSWSGSKPQIFHFSTLTRQETDIVLEGAAGRLVGIEVKTSATITSSDFKGLRALQDTAGKRFMRGVVLYAGAESVAFGPNLFALPLASLWQPMFSDV
jgi:uncharacterized protein